MRSNNVAAIPILESVTCMMGDGMGAIFHCWNQSSTCQMEADLWSQREFNISDPDFDTGIRTSFTSLSSQCLDTRAAPTLARC